MNAQVIYLREVLGVESWISTPSPEPVVGLPPPALTILYRQSWSQAERTMMEKILTAMNLLAPLAEIANLEELHSPHLLIFDSSSVGKISSNGQTQWHLGPIQKLLIGQPEEIQAAKRDVWNLLKNLKEEIG